MEHRTLVQRSSQSVQRELCSPIEQPGYVTQSRQLLCCGGLWESTHWLCSLRTKPRRVARCQRRCSTVRRLISVQARSFSSGVCRANLLVPPEARGHDGHSAGSGGFVVLCGIVRQIADSISEPRGANRHRANRSWLAARRTCWMGAPHLALGCASAARACEETATALLWRSAMATNALSFGMCTTWTDGRRCPKSTLSRRCMVLEI